MLAGFSRTAKTYYAVDFLGGGMPSGGAPRGSSRQSQLEKNKTIAVNPQEDLLLKSKKKSNKKEILSTAPAVPAIPIPKAPSRVESEPSDVPSAIPNSGSGGIGIGFGDGGFGSGSGGAGNFPYAWYVHAIRKRLDSNWNVTSGFSERIFAQVAFTIKRDGSLVDIEVEESSKSDAFDQTALRAVQTSSPLPPLPQGYDESALRVHVRFAVKR